MGKMQFLIFLGYSFSEITILQKANPLNNNSAVIRLIISKSTHHPTNKTLFNLPRGINFLLQQHHLLGLYKLTSTNLVKVDSSTYRLAEAVGCIPLY